METLAHLRLKRLALEYLAAGGCSAAAVEVRCPIARHRADAAGYLDPLPARDVLQLAAAGAPPAGKALCFGRGRLAKSVIIECKQSRADFLTDSRNAEETLAERDRLERVRVTLEEQIVKACEPHLRQSGSALFADLETWDFSRSRVASYRAVLRDLKRIDERLHGESKFWLMARYRLADWLYLLAPRGVIRAREVPPGWGLLEVDEEAIANEHTAMCVSEVHIRVAAAERAGRIEHRTRLLRNIAVASTRQMLAALTSAHALPPEASPQPEDITA